MIAYDFAKVKGDIMADHGFYDVLIVVEGAKPHLDAFFSENLGEKGFSFCSIAPMPPELDFEMDNFVEDGYNALYGDWGSLTGRRMFKEAAAKHGFPFPLTNQEQIIECIRELGEYGEKRLKLGKLFKSNLDRFGHGHKIEWRRANWGVECDVEELIVKIDDNSIGLSFSLCGTIPKKILNLISKAYKELKFLIFYASETGKRGKKYLIKNGREIEKFTFLDEEIFRSIYTFRISYGIKWINEISCRNDCDKSIKMSENGRAFFIDTQIAVRFAVGFAIDGEKIEKISARIPELNSIHLKFLESLLQNYKLLKLI